MDEICRLCCSRNFVNNSIFDEENALYLKMSLYLPIKVFKNDRLPQRICDKCSCKVNDFYQFCNETIEVQNRLRSIYLSSGVITNESIDLTVIKENVHSPPPLPNSSCDQGTQTEVNVDTNTQTICDTVDQTLDKTIKKEPEQLSLPVVKSEDVQSDNDNYAPVLDVHSDSSDNMSLISLKKKKRKTKTEKMTNGEVGEHKKSKGRRRKLKDWEQLMNNLPPTNLLVVTKNGVDNSCLEAWEATVVKKEPTQLIDSKEDVKKNIKKEPIEDESYHCCICFAQFQARSDILYHYRQHGSEADAEIGEAIPPPPPPPHPPADKLPARCTRCQKVVEGGAGGWASHWRAHWERDRKPYRCALCEKSFRDHHQILKHGLTHKLGAEGQVGDTKQQLDKRFVCDLCPESFVYMRYLLAHRTRAHPEAATRALALRCATCARTFAHLNSLRRHQRAHSGERNFLCNVCGKALSSREHLKFHIRIHTGYKPNICKTCGKGFVKKCNLTLHERVHSGEKPHVCSHCGKAFSQRSTLVIHERYHSGARPYTCALCGRGFVAKGLLSMHLKTTCI